MLYYRDDPSPIPPGDAAPGPAPPAERNGTMPEDFDIGLYPALTPHTIEKCYNRIQELKAKTAPANFLEALVWSENPICLNFQGLRSFAGSR